MAYVEFNVVVDGADDGSIIFTDDEHDAKVAWFGREKQELTMLATAGEIERGEIFSVRHEHELDDQDCQCIQYVTDHNPEFVVEA